MPLPPIDARPSRLSGLAAAFVLVALLSGPSGPSAAVQPAAGAAPQWIWPIGPTHHIVRPFIAPATQYSAGHRGIDIDAAAGDMVLAPASGVVHFAGVVVDRPLVSIRHADGLISSFEPVSPTVAEGDPITAGAAIGTLEPGHCASPCLHLGARLHGQYVSPLNYLGGIEPSVLLPTRRLESG